MKFNCKRNPTVESSFPRVAPFALFMIFIALNEFIRFLMTKNVVSFSETTFLFAYPVKTVTVGFLLFFFRNSYKEIRWADLKRPSATFSGILTGFIVFILWINMDWAWATMGSPLGYNPTLVTNNFTLIFLIISRIVGAALIVPIMEEIFWRSWLLRYLISPDISTVPIGTFSWASFVVASVLFGLEHNLWFAGIMAGALYSLLLYRTKSLAQCIVAHGVTNLLLGIYVIKTGKWFFW